MKTNYLIPLAIACTVSAMSAQQQGQDGPPPPPPPQGEGMRDKMRDRMMDRLPPELRDRFEAARNKAMQDPAIQELKKKADSANDEFRKAMRDAMIKADPGLAEVIKEQIGKRGGEGKDGKRDQPPGFANLSENDRQKLMAAREKAKDDPAVVAAEQKKEAAKTPEERKSAMEEFHKAMKAALLKADSTLGPILDQLKPPQGPKPQGAGAPPPMHPED